MIDLRKGDQPDYLISATGEPWNVSALNASDTLLNVHGVSVIRDMDSYMTPGK